MNKLTAQLVVSGAQLILDDKFSGMAPVLCVGAYDNFPFVVAEMLVSQQPVKISLTTREGRMIREFILTENGGVKMMPKLVVVEVEKEEYSLDNAVIMDMSDIDDLFSDHMKARAGLQPVRK